MSTPVEPTKDLLDVTSTPLGALLLADRDSLLSRAAGRIVDEVIGVGFHVQLQAVDDDGNKGDGDKGEG